jgi:hypothetical protein
MFIKREQAETYLHTAPGGRLDEREQKNPLGFLSYILARSLWAKVFGSSSLHPWTMDVKMVDFPSLSIMLQFSTPMFVLSATQFFSG